MNFEESQSKIAYRREVRTCTVSAKSIHTDIKTNRKKWKTKEYKRKHCGFIIRRNKGKLPEIHLNPPTTSI